MENFLLNPESVKVLMMFGIPIVAIIAATWKKVRINQSNNDLKQSMLDRGMLAQEIEQVMNSGTK